MGRGASMVAPWSMQRGSSGSNRKANMFCNMGSLHTNSPMRPCRGIQPSGRAEAMGKPAPERAEVERYRKEKEQIKERADELTRESEGHMKEHVTYSRAVTMSQIAIAVAAISVLSKRPMFRYLSMGFGLVGVFFLIRGLMG